MELERGLLRFKLFLSTPSARRATTPTYAPQRGQRYFYPRPPRGGRRRACVGVLVRAGISIHALREEGDGCQPAPGHSVRRISIHALREEGDSCRCGHTWLSAYFYPRPPRGGRPRRSAGSGWHSTISIHALREEGDGRKHKPFAGKGISIHALREEGDPSETERGHTKMIFLSTPSARRATVWLPFAFPPFFISIHALREEGDLSYG